MLRISLFVLVGVLFAQDDVALRVDVRLVPVTVSITDANGKPIDDIRREEITLLDNGKPREIQFYGRDVNVPLTIGLIADMSGSQADWTDEHSLHLKQFISQVLQPDDRAFLVKTGGTRKSGGNPRLLRDLTGSVSDLLAGVDALDPASRAGELFGDPCPRISITRPLSHCSSSPVWNPVYAAARLRMRGVSGRKAIVLLSDGIDNGSQHGLGDTIEEAQGADTVVYAIHSPLRGPLRFHPVPWIRGAQGKGSLERLAEETGGGFYRAEDDLGAVYAQIEAELRSLYVLGFVLPAEARDGKFHKLEVKVARPGVRVRARKGYTVER